VVEVQNNESVLSAPGASVGVVRVVGNDVCPELVSIALTLFFMAFLAGGIWSSLLARPEVIE